ncbi:MAG TPA: hypothetical protein VFJ43_15865 [Bacteroidia bacterium]|nr:hypothetical protein [Bacteroidia bacterium]
MKKILLLVFILANSVLFAQKNKGDNFHWLSEQIVVGVSGGQFHPDLSALNTQLTAFGAKPVFNEGLRGYGLTLAIPLALSRALDFDGAIAFDDLLPAKVTIGKNDSLTYQLSGWNLMTSTYGKDVIPGKTVALVLAPGFDWGSLKMITALKGNGSLLRNSFIAPMGRAELRFVFGPVALGARGCYRYDVTKNTWKLKSGPAVAIPGVKNTGVSIEFFVGWGHVHFQ